MELVMVARELGGGLLIPVYRDPGDSGIDSDDTDDGAGRAADPHPADEPGLELRDESSSGSEEDVVIKPWWIRPRKVHDLEELMKELMDVRLQPNNRLPFHYTPSPPVYELPSVGDSGSERGASPPLYEVELTASDEEDDASVLELVIPMQNSRYQRVPTSSPEKVVTRPPKRYSLCGWLCCLSRK